MDHRTDLSANGSSTGPMKVAPLVVDQCDRDALCGRSLKRAA
jgi:hypothetical protein